MNNNSLRKKKSSSGQEDPFSLLKVIDSLEVGPILLEKRRLVAPYSIRRGSTRDSFSLIYRYNENVFDPAQSASRNLADMIAAQVAVNYGLFCYEIRFNGLFDESDRRFIQHMMNNTAQEIYVKKFLEPNPFIKGPAAEFPIVRKDSYLDTELIFTEKAPTKKDLLPEAAGWKTDPAVFAVLSSGGKDSLLSFGLMQEIHREAHPIFINESGRHWFTALNAYRYFTGVFPQTAKVWVNSDRLFAFMLRHLPFIRKDFAQLRSDEYPIRLWTVAVFLFGALPLLRKRGIGNLIIGDEYDTTAHTSFRGIPHYNGLYDQSRYFDNACTRFFFRKHWNIRQFSILRPLSEFLIEKILAERYPFLQQHQVSCHASHMEGSRVHPCGRCEKCRRIVAMLTALDINPKNCGYTEGQINFCLKEFALKGAHQESPGVQHVLFLLQQKGIIDLKENERKARKHIEIEKLRFDPTRSPMESIPEEIREPLYSILLRHAKSAVIRQGRIWLDFDPINKSELAKPYPFSTTHTNIKISEKDLSKETKSTHKLGSLTWPEARMRFKEVDIALLPVGSLEQHGPHLPLDTDAFDAKYLAEKVASACTTPKPLVLPLIPYGVSYHHMDFNGTITISPETLSRLVHEIGMSAAKNGITKLVIINGHGGNIPALQFAAQTINRDAHIFTCVETGETSRKDLEKIIETPNDVHAGEEETSTTLAVRPEVVRSDKMKKFIPRFSSRYLNFSSKRSVEWNARIVKISPTGVMGDPTKASAKKGSEIWALMIKHLVEFIEDLKSMSLDEIMQKRY